MESELEQKLKLPPNSIDVEMGILSACFVGSEETLVEIMSLIEPEYFYNKANQKIFDAIKRLGFKSVNIDSVSVAEVLRDGGLIESVGGLSYFSKILDYPPAVDVKFYCERLEQYFLLRKAIEKCHATIKKCHDRNSDFDDTITYFIESAHSVSEGSKAKDPVLSLANICMEGVEIYNKRYLEKKLVTGAPTGIIDLDKMTSGLQDGNLILLAARPAMGKTAFALNVMRNMARLKIPSLMFSLEMTRTQLLDRLVAIETKIKGQDVRVGNLTKQEFELLNEKLSIIHDYPIHIDDRGGMTLEDIVRISRRHKIMHPDLRVIVVDHLHLIRGKYYDKRNIDVGLMSAGLKALAKELRVPILCLCQLNRELERRNNPFKRPRLSDLRDSGSLEQDADDVIFLYRPWVYGDNISPETGDQVSITEQDCELIVSKQRQGPTGMIKCLFYDSIQRFEGFTKISPDDIYQNGGILDED